MRTPDNFKYNFLSLPHSNSICTYIDVFTVTERCKNVRVNTIAAKCVIHYESSNNNNNLRTK